MVLFTPQNPEIARNIVQFLRHISTSLQSAENSLLDAALCSILPFVQIDLSPASVLEDIY
jgi:hypothetical protein